MAALGLGGSLTLSDGVLDGDGGVVLGGAAADVLLVRAGDDVVVLRRGRPGWASRRQGPRPVSPLGPGHRVVVPVGAG